MSCRAEKEAGKDIHCSTKNAALFLSIVNIFSSLFLHLSRLGTNFILFW